MRHALSAALQGFSGAMVIVSHDRYLLKTVTDELIIVHNGKAEEFDGDLDDYAVFIKEAIKHSELSGSKIEGEPETKELSKKEQRQLEAERRKQLQPLSNKLKQLEKKLDKVSSEKDTLEKLLADPDIYLTENKEKLKKCLLEKSTVDKALDEIEMQWMEAGEAYEEASQAISL